MDFLNCNMVYLFIKLFEDVLNEYVYNVGLVGLSYSLMNMRVGFFVGYFECIFFLMFIIYINFMYVCICI